MRISDWSSDVCSSDLDKDRSAHRFDQRASCCHRVFRVAFQVREGAGDLHLDGIKIQRRHLLDERLDYSARPLPFSQKGFPANDDDGEAIWRQRLVEMLADSGGLVRSEENTSELMSLMRISYAV